VASGYQTIRELISELGVRGTVEVLALTEDNDPFYCGRPAHVKDGEWFAALWQRFGFARGVHLRSIHYRLVVTANVTKPDDTPYVNTEKCWKYLQIAAKCARYLGLVDASDFVDQRSPDPHLFATYREEAAEPAWMIPEPEWRLPQIILDFACWLALPDPEASGYDYELADQHFHLIIWIEKSTMNDVLLPICQRYGVDLIPDIGFASITRVIQMLQRFQAKPVRIFYISDFDPGGMGMPVGVARQFEYWRKQYAPDSDIKLTPLALTKEQALHYRLPRVPIKETNPGKQRFEEAHGEGAELDALEALYPGELARLVEEAISPYFDANLESRLVEAENGAHEEIEAAWEEETADLASELKAIRAESDKVVKQFKKRAETLAHQFNAAMEPLRERLALARKASSTTATVWRSTCPIDPNQSRPMSMRASGCSMPAASTWSKSSTITDTRPVKRRVTHERRDAGRGLRTGRGTTADHERTAGNSRDFSRESELR
jgi:hypothetical protein